MNDLKVISFIVKILILFFIFKYFKEESTDDKLTIIYTTIVAFQINNSFKKECKK